MRKCFWHLKKEKKDEKLDQPLVEASTTNLEETTTYEYFGISNNISLLYAWVSDLGASFNMSPHRDGFDKYNLYSCGMVYLDDDHPLEIVERGDIKIKMNDGR